MIGITAWQRNIFIYECGINSFQKNLCFMHPHGQKAFLGCEHFLLLTPFIAIARFTFGKYAPEFLRMSLWSGMLFGYIRMGITLMGIIEASHAPPRPAFGIWFCAHAWRAGGRASGAVDRGCRQSATGAGGSGSADHG
ncbi:MAG: hypothetical protein INF74_11825 [Roseomonas sp.]|nr:hypothetical protein [Roseomonas sp.]